MAVLAQVRAERRKHPRYSRNGLIAEIRGKRYAILDISFGGMKIDGDFTVAGGLIDAVIRPRARDAEEWAEVRGRVERVDDGQMAVRFSSITQAMARLIDKE